MVHRSNATTHQAQSISALEQAVQTQLSHVASNIQTIENNSNAMASLFGQFTHQEEQATMAHSTTEQTLGRIEQKMDAMPSFSQTQFDTIKSMLEQLSLQQAHFVRPEPCSPMMRSSAENIDSDSSSNSRPGSHPDSDSDASTPSMIQSRTRAQTPSVLQSIRRLSNLVDKQAKTVGSSEAVDIISDLQTLLSAVCMTTPAKSAEKRKRDKDDSVAKSDVKRVGGFLTPLTR